MTPNYDKIVDIARHCDRSKLEIAEQNALTYDLTPLMCRIEKHLEGIDDSDPIYSGGKVGIFDFGGLNKIYALYSYARYVEGSIYVDTGSGFVRKDHGNSFPLQMSDVKDVASQHRTMAVIEWDRLNAHICSISNSNSCICDGVYCSSKERNSTLTGRRFRNISRRRR